MSVFVCKDMATKFMDFILGMGVLKGDNQDIQLF